MSCHAIIELKPTACALIELTQGQNSYYLSLAGSLLAIKIYHNVYFPSHGFEFISLIIAHQT